MSRKFKILKDYYDEDVNIYKRGTVTLEPGLTVLVGCNGAGKTTLLRQIKSELKREDIPYVDFDNLHDGGSNARSKAAFHNDFTFVAQSMCSSEGENISLNIEKFARVIGEFVRKNNDKNELWILLDAIDSGLSVDAIEDIKEGLFNTIFEYNTGKEIYIICSANEYELARGEKCFDVVNCRYVSIKSYEKYRSVVMKSREIKDKRYQNNE